MSLALRFTAYDPYRSFGKDQPGLTEHRLVDVSTKDLRFISDEEVWQFGMRAWTTLVERVGSEPSTDLLNQNLKAVNDALNELLGAVNENPTKDHLLIQTRDEVPVEIADLINDDWALSQKARVVYVVSKMAEEEGEPSEEAGLPFDWEALFALLALRALDDVVVSEFLDGRGLAANVLEAAALLDLANEDKLREEIERKVHISHQTKAARARHRETDGYRKEVIAAWKSGDFKTVAEVARWALRQFPIKTEVTIRRWIARHGKGASNR